jgi:hypothetical protein
MILGIGKEHSRERVLGKYTSGVATQPILQKRRKAEGR